MNRLFRIVGVLILFIVFLATPSPAFAANEKVGTYDDIPDVFDKVFQQGITALTGTISETVDAMLLKYVKFIIEVPGKTTRVTDATILREMNRKTALGGAVTMGLAMYSNPPANLALWVRDTGQTLGFIPRQAYAQGIGFSGLSPLLPLWKAFRNIAYLLLALALIVIGFMVMLRKKIDPKTVVTVQNALPRIVITLILITFSYAIVGLMIDLMYVLLFTFAIILKQAGNSIYPNLFGNDIPSTFVTTGGVQLWNWVFGGGFKALDDILGFLNPLTQGDPTQLVTSVGQGLSIALATLLYDVEGILLTIVLAVLLLFAVFRILAMLVGAYIQIIISVIFAPLFLLIDVFPGAEGFASWIKNLTANILVFPMTAVLFMIIFILDTATANASGAASMWSPPILFPGGQYGLTGVIGIGMLLAIPKLVGSVKEALKAKPAIGFGIGGGGQSVMQLVSTAFYAKSLAPAGLWKRLGLGGEAGAEKHG